MSTSLDLRRVRIGIEVGNSVKYYEGLRTRITGTKYADPVKNECTVTISNLNQTTRNQILTQTSPFNNGGQTRRIIVEIGRVSTGLFQLFIGDVVGAEPSMPPDCDLTIKAQTEAASAQRLVAKSAGASANLSQIAKDAAKDLGLELDFQATDMTIANFSYSGPASGQVAQLQKAGNVQAFVDDGKLVVKPTLSPLADKLIKLNKDSGMIGIPVVNEKGIKVSMLADPNAIIGGAVEISSVLNSAINGTYIINQLQFDITTHEDSFNYTLLGTRY